MDTNVITFQQAANDDRQQQTIILTTTTKTRFFFYLREKMFRFPFPKEFHLHFIIHRRIS